MRLWVVGNAEGSIGETIARRSPSKYEEIIGTGREVDVRDWSALDEFVAKQGPFDHVAYCAGIAGLHWIPEMEEYDLEEIFAVNVFGFIGTMAALSANQKGGRVVAVVSDAARTPMRGSMAYCTSKAALEMAVRCAARELAPVWQVNGVSPSAVDGTRMTEWIDRSVPEFRGWSMTEARMYELATIPMKRRAQKQEVAQVVLDVLNGPDFLTGSIITLTGGK